MTATVTAHERGTIPMLVPGSDGHRRQPFVSASKAGVLFGVDPFCDVHKLAAIRRGEDTDEAGEAAQVGMDIEDWVAQWWADRIGAAVIKPEVTYTFGPLSASPDRLIADCPTDLLEVKATSRQEGPMPASHFWQAQCQMACTGTERVHFAYFFGGSLARRALIVVRDDAAIGELVERAGTFLAHLEMGLDPPEPAEQEAAEETVTLGEGEVGMFRQLGLLNEAKNGADKEAKQIRAQLVALLGAPGMTAGSRLTAVDADGKPVGKLRVQRGREETTGTGIYGDSFAVVSAL